MTTAVDELFLSPLSEAPQDFSSTAVYIDGVLHRPDLQPHQHNTDVQRHIHLRENRTYMSIHLMIARTGSFFGIDHKTKSQTYAIDVVSDLNHLITHRCLISLFVVKLWKETSRKILKNCHFLINYPFYIHTF